MTHSYSKHGAARSAQIMIEAVGAIAATAIIGSSAEASQWHAPVAYAPPRIAVERWDRRHPAWWRGHPWFAGYRGLRRGYFFVPGRGYVPVPRAYYGRRWLVGHIVPPVLRRFHVHDVAFYRLRPAPPGHAWIYVDNNIVLMRVATGVIVDVLHRIW